MKLPLEKCLSGTQNDREEVTDHELSGSPEREEKSTSRDFLYNY